MNKQITSILLVAGTCIGAGMLALPMSLAKLGVVPSVILMLAMWFLTYYPSLVSVELNLHCERGLSLGLLGKKFSGKAAEMMGEISVKMLSYALLAAYIYAGSSVIQKLISAEISSFAIQTILSTIVVLTLLFPTRIVSKINNIAFIGFLGLFLLLIAKVVSCIDYSIVPWNVEPTFSNFSAVATIVFTSFGYQVIFHSLRDYCGKDVKMLKRAFFYGSIIPMIVYMVWTCGVLCIIYKSNYEFFSLMLKGKIDVGDLIKELSIIFKFSELQIVVWWLSICTILTSIIGVGIGLSESYNLLLTKNKFKCSQMLAALFTVLPAYLISTIVPNAFIKILSFAGAILVIIAILLPSYLLFKTKILTPYIVSLKKSVLIVCVVFGISIMVLEFL